MAAGDVSGIIPTEFSTADAGTENKDVAADAVTENKDVAADAVGDKAASDKVAADKATADKAVADKAAADKATAEKPIEYKFNLPEGFKADDKALGELTPVLQKHKISQEAAQALVDAHVKQVQGFHEANAKVWGDLSDKWLETAKSDKEIGGAKFSESAGKSREAITKFGTPALAKLFKDLRLENHPEVIRFTSRIGSFLSEGSIHQGKGSGNATKTLEQRIFPDLK